jgi:hypothetical protein
MESTVRNPTHNPPTRDTGPAEGSKPGAGQQNAGHGREIGPHEIASANNTPVPYAVVNRLYGPACVRPTSSTNPAKKEHRLLDRQIRAPPI